MTRIAAVASRHVVAALARLTLSTTLALFLGLMALGCESSGGMGGPIHHGEGEGPSVPKATVSALEACAKRGRDRLKEPPYVFQFNVEVTESGRAGRVRLKDSYPRDSGLDACLGRALEGMQVPPAAEQRLFQQGQAVSPPSRGLIGNPLPAAAAALAGVELAPVFIEVGADAGDALKNAGHRPDDAGVTVIVSVTVYASEEVIESKRKEECLKVGQSCLPVPPCSLVVDDPHESGHQPGTVNVVARVKCDRNVQKIDLIVALNRNGPEVSSKMRSNMGGASLTVNTATADCVKGTYQGVAYAVVTYPPGSLRPHDDLSATSSKRDLTCQ